MCQYAITNRYYYLALGLLLRDYIKNSPTNVARYQFILFEAFPQKNKKEVRSHGNCYSKG